MALRSDFGKDLAKVTAADRKRVDETCTPLLADAALKGRAPYLDCMVEQLTAISRNRRKGGTAFAAAMAAAPAASDESPVPTPPASRRASGMSMPTMIVATLGVVAVGGGIAFVAMRSKKSAMRTCRGCGAAVPDSDLCANCRRETAEALRRANAERVEQQRQAADEVRRESEREAARSAQATLREAEAARVRAHDEQRDREHAAKIAEAVAPNAPEPPPAPSGYEEESTDPYVILGVKPDAAPDAIRAAYDQAKKKYDPDLVGHLSEEVQSHYRAKSEAVDKAFQALSSGPQAA
jgi:DnaJ-domain-containing protein 1